MLYINKTLFKKEWKELEKYYKKTHTRDEANLYYLKLQDLTDEKFLVVVDLVYKKCRYFPNIAEIRNLLPDQKIQQMKAWENIQTRTDLDEEDKAYARDFYKRYCDTEEEYQEKIKKYGLE